MKIINSLLIISTIAIAQLGSVAPSKADYADDLVKSHSQYLFGLRGGLDSDEGRLYSHATKKCILVITRPNDYPSDLIDNCERLSGMVAWYKQDYQSCISVLIDPSKFPRGLQYYCERKTGETTISIYKVLMQQEAKK